ncbi:unnamed protein product [Pseudo-nitzschia multistriata]|uniref:SET domain-containing protein n=1 Tax=Pseudo-nitzschia multistriata TaxID=183589 RepID=A0A448ZQC9_9STRA|nr:unnamed protein product [Pseudo-nitzschia multistriata]
MALPRNSAVRHRCHRLNRCHSVWVPSLVLFAIFYPDAVKAFTTETGTYLSWKDEIRSMHGAAAMIHPDRLQQKLLCTTSLNASPPEASEEKINLMEEASGKEFLEYMFRHRGCQGEPDAVTILVDESTGYRGLYVSCKEGIQKGDYIFAVPFSSAWIVESEKDGDECGGGREGELSDSERGLRFWNWRNERGRDKSNEDDDDDWKPYLCLLPSNESNDASLFDPTPDFWPDDEIRALELPLAVEQALAKKKMVRDQAAAIAADHSCNKSIVSEDELRFATWLINSRAVTVILQNEDEKEEEDHEDTDEDDYLDVDNENFTATCVLVPLLDMINHSSEVPNAYFSVLGDDGDDDEDEGVQEQDDDDGEELFYAVIADRDIREGEEILISYGSEQDSSLDLLLQYGFVPSENPFDVDFWDSLSSESDNDTDGYGYGCGGSLDGSCWSTTLEEDVERRNQLSLATTETETDGLTVGDQRRSIEIERIILDFRIRMKRAFADWKA